MGSEIPCPSACQDVDAQQEVFGQALRMPIIATVAVGETVSAPGQKYTDADPLAGPPRPAAFFDDRSIIRNR